MEGNLRFKIDWASLVVGSKFTVLLCFTLYLRAIFQVQPPGGLIFGGAYTWNFTVAYEQVFDLYGDYF